jgi:enoyl-CoA hydratase/carnithine racemase
MSDTILLVEEFGPVMRLTINRPKAMNALNRALLRELDAALDTIVARGDVRVLILTGTGAAFCAGADLKEAMAVEPEAAGTPDFIDQCNVVMHRLRTLELPVIAALNGITMAGGLELAMCADIVIAGQSAKIGDAHANFGVYPGAGGAAILPRLIPLNMAMYLLFTGKTLSAIQMQALGLVAEVHADAALADAALKLATQIAAKSPAALRRMKAVARTSADKSRDDALLHEQVMFRAHMRSADLQEGLAAFAEKRPPQFSGR